MLLKMLADDDPVNQESQYDSFNSEPELAEEILMVLSSRPRHYPIDDMPEVKRSIINYGVSDIFPSDLSRTDRNRIIESRLLEALQLFEPRLSNIYVSAGNNNGTLYIIDALYREAPIRLYLEWDDLLCKFSFSA